MNKMNLPCPFGPVTPRPPVVSLLFFSGLKQVISYVIESQLKISSVVSQTCLLVWSSAYCPAHAHASPIASRSPADAGGGNGNVL